MKLLLENWRSYTASLLNEDLLIESFDDAYETVRKRAAKLIKGWTYSNDKATYDKIENAISEYVENAKQNPDPVKRESSLNSFKTTWDLAGHYIANRITNNLPYDIDDKQKGIAMLWNYKQFAEGHIVPLGTYFEDVIKALGPDYTVFVNIFGRSFNLRDISYRYNENFAFSHMSDEEETDPRRSHLIEKFFHWNNFITNGKKDLNSVQDYGELGQLVKDAGILYKQWQEKQEQKDAEAGKEVLLDNDRWQIIVIHNKGAACQLGKGTDWCTAAPGLEYFKQYYKPNDPLFYILDKSDDARYQFHFGSKQFMDEWDSPLRPTSTIYRQIMEVLTDVVPPKYTKAWNFWTHQIEIDKEEED